MIISFESKSPKIKENVRVADNSSVIGDVTLEHGSNIWYGVVLRGDITYIHVGKNTNIQDNTVVHVSENYPVEIGSNVVIGHSAIVHGCTVGNNCLIGIGAILLDGCIIGDNCLVAAGAVVTNNTVIPPGSVVMGVPGKVVRATTEEDIDSTRAACLRYLKFAQKQLTAAK